MKKYSVSDVAKLLDKNPETIRRWIRDGKLSAEFNSNKEGHLVTEKMLDAFLASSPKYAKAITPLMKTPIGTVAVASTMVGSLLAKQYLKNERIKSAEVDPTELRKLINEEITDREKIITEKQREITGLQKEVDEERRRIIELQLLERELENFQNQIFEQEKGKSDK